MGCPVSKFDQGNKIDNFPAGEGETLHHGPSKTNHSFTATTTPRDFQDDDAIAIVGVGCRSPGAENLDGYWRVLKNGECHIGDVPPSRWNAAAFLDPDPNALCKAYVQKGGFITDVESFDNALYGINDYEAAQMDPQQFLLLDCTAMAMEDGGLTRQQMSGSNTGVFVGAMNNDYTWAYYGRNSKINTYTGTGISNAILASRVSYVFDLRGPCLVVDTACSASLVAIHQACLAIRSGDCNMAICGGVNCILSPDMYIKLSKARMISPTGLCHTFSENADGYARGEGCGVVILKRLKDALRDGNKVWATINTGTNQDGRSVTPMTAPSGEQQKKLLDAIYSKYKADISQLDYIEAHGTGTPAGDPVEVNALGSFLKERGGPRRSRYIGSVKTNIGHTESAAGILSLIKILLMMKHKTIVPSLHCQTVNPKLDLQSWQFVIPKELVPWDSPNKLAACNSFGFGGSNAHVVVYSFTSTQSAQAPAALSRKNTISVVCFSAKTQKGLKDSMEDMYSDPHVPLLDVEDIAYTSTVRRDHSSYRAAFVAEDMPSLLNALGDRLSSSKWPGPVSTQPSVVFVFCGMGTAWDGMCRQLLRDLPVFREAVEKVEEHLASHVRWSLTLRLLQENACNDPVLTPLAIFACQVGLDAVWKSLGVCPYSVVGQSVGEVAAAYSTGCISLADAVAIMYHRSRLLAESSGGKMIVVQNVEVEKVRQVLEKYGSKMTASISLEYSPRACAVSTDSETMMKLRPLLLSELKSAHRDMQMIDLDVTVAYHSPHVAASADKLREITQSIKSNSPALTFVSTVTGKIVKEPLDIGHWENNMKKPVLFHQAMLATVNSKSMTNTIFLEIGPRPILRVHLPDLFPGKNCQAIPSVLKTSETKSLFQAIATLYESGVDMKYGSLYKDHQKLTNVPRYIFQRKNIREKTEEEVLYGGGCNLLKKNHLFVFPIEGPVASHKMLLSPLTLPSVYQHHVSGEIVVPGALYVEVGFAVAHYCCLTSPFRVSVDFQQLLLLEKDQVVDADIVSDTVESADGTRVYLVRRAGKQLAKINCKRLDGSDISKEIINIELLRSKCTKRVSKSGIYSVLSSAGFDYGESFSLLESGQKNASECLVMLQINSQVSSEMTDMTIHPCILDCALQSTSLVEAKSSKKNSRKLPKAIGSISVYGKMQKIMYVNAKLKSHDDKYQSFDINVLSPNGDVIVFISDFTMQTLPSLEIKQGPDMLEEKWNKAKDLPPEGFPVQEKAGQSNILVITENVTDLRSTKKTTLFSLKYNGSTQIDKFRDELNQSLKAHTVDALMFIVAKQEQSALIGQIHDAEGLQSGLIQLCLLIQNTCISVNTHSPNTPIYMLTFDAFPSAQAGGSAEHDINPVARAVWGLVRTAVAESAVSEIVSVELQTKQISDTNMTSNSLFSLLELLQDENITGFPEVFLTDDAVFVNQVVPVVSSMLTPQQRSSSSKKVQDLKGQMIFLSADSENLNKLQAVHHHLSSASDAEKMSIRVENFVKPNKKLMNLRLSSEQVLSSKNVLRYVVMSIEVCGVSEDGTEHEVAACCPLPVGPVVSVPKQLVFQTSSLPQYRVGDLCKYILLYSLVEKADTMDCTILASEGTLTLAHAAKAMFYDSNKTNIKQINIVKLEDLQQKCSFASCVISLVLLDADIMQVTSGIWPKVDFFLTCRGLINDDAQTFMTLVFPDTKIHLIDTQQLFQPKSLREVVPRLRDWVIKNTSSMPAIAEYLHAEGTNESNSCNIQPLFCFKRTLMSDLNLDLKEDSLFTEDGIYVVAGGLTGLGWLCVEFLATNQAGYIAILNRRSPNNEQHMNIKQLIEKFSCKIKAFSADIADMESLQKIMHQVTKEWAIDGYLKGVFTGAAVLEDKPFQTMDIPAFDKVLTPKVKGTWNLHLLTKHLPLDYFVMHSSVASVLGNHGQTNYTAANAFMDGLAFHRAHHGLAAQTINWGPLDTGLLDNQDSVKKRLEAMGFCLASQDEIKKTLSIVLHLKTTQAMPVMLDSKKYSSRMRSAGITAMLKRFQHLLADKADGGDSEGNVTQSIDKIKDLESPKRLQQYESYVQQLVVRVLGVDAARVTPDVSLYSVGMDSVTGMMMLNLIERQAGFTLPNMVVLSNDVTVSAIARALDACADQKQSK